MGLNRNFIRSKRLRFVRFLVVGIIAYSVDIIGFFVFFRISGSLPLAFVGASVFGTAASFILTSRFVFLESQPAELIAKLLWFGGVAGTVMGLNYLIGLGIDSYSIEFTGVRLLILRTTVLGVMFVLKYLMLLAVKFR